jgi:hypothetical protein
MIVLKDDVGWGVVANIEKNARVSSLAMAAVKGNIRPEMICSTSRNNTGASSASPSQDGSETKHAHLQQLLLDSDKRSAVYFEEDVFVGRFWLFDSLRMKGDIRSYSMWNRWGSIKANVEKDDNNKEDSCVVRFLRCRTALAPNIPMGVPIDRLFVNPRSNCHDVEILDGENYFGNLIQSFLDSTEVPDVLEVCGTVVILSF